VAKIIFTIVALIFVSSAHAEVATIEDLKTYKCSAIDSNTELVASSTINAVDAKSALMLAVRDFKISKKKSGEFFITQPAKCGFAHEGCLPSDRIVASLICND